MFPLTTVQTWIIHLIRNSLAFVSWKDRKLIMPDLKAIYRAETAEAGAAELDNFEAQWGKRYPAIGQAWRRAWEYVVPLFAFPSAIRKMIRPCAQHKVGEIEAELAAAEEESKRTAEPARRFKDFAWTTRDGWSRERRVVAKAEWTAGEANTRFVVTSLSRWEHDTRHLYEKVYCARGEMENRIKSLPSRKRGSASSTSSPTPRRPRRCAPTSCACGSHRWLVCSCARTVASASPAPSSPCPRPSPTKPSTAPPTQPPATDPRRKACRYDDPTRADKPRPPATHYPCHHPGKTRLPSIIRPRPTNRPAVRNAG